MPLRSTAPKDTHASVKKRRLLKEQENFEVEEPEFVKEEEACFQAAFPDVWIKTEFDHPNEKPFEELAKSYTPGPGCSKARSSKKKKEKRPRKKRNESLADVCLPAKKIRRMTQFRVQGGSAGETIEPYKKEQRFYTKLKPGELKVKYRRNLKILPIRVNSDAAKFHMQRKADAIIIGQTKAINRHWEKVKIWCDGISRKGKSVYKERAHPFIHKEQDVGIKFSEFEGMCKQDPLHVFYRLFGKQPAGRAHSTFKRILNATNDSIAMQWDPRNLPPKRKIGGRPEGKRFRPTMPASGYVTGGELLSFLGIQFLISYHRLPHLTMFWERQPDSGIGLGIIQHTMSRDRFRFISKHLACTSPEEIEETVQGLKRPDSISSIRPLVEELNDRFKKCRQPPRVQSIGECMIMIKGRLVLRQMMANNPMKNKFKFLSRCDNQGYTYQLESYDSTRVGPNKTNPENDFVDKIFYDLCVPLSKQGHIVAFDSFSTSVSLMDSLYSIGVNAVGTINAKRVRQAIGFEKRLKEGEYRAKFGGEPGSCRKGIFIWKDNAIFRLMSNYHGSDIVKVQRKQRVGTSRDKNCPKAMDDYNRYIGGVHAANQLRSCYEKDRRSKKWWHRIFYALLETTLVNSWICFNDLVKAGKLDGYMEPMSLLDFKRSVTIGLLTAGLNYKPLDAGGVVKLTPKINLVGTPGTKRRRSRLSVRDEIRFSGVGVHLPVFVEKRGRCEWCQKFRQGLESRSYSVCVHCNVHLCISRKKNCFYEYHDETYFANCDLPSNALEATYSSDNSDEDENLRVPMISKPSDDELSNYPICTSNSVNPSEDVSDISTVSDVDSQHYGFLSDNKGEDERLRAELLTLAFANIRNDSDLKG